MYICTYVYTFLFTCHLDVNKKCMYKWKWTNTIPRVNAIFFVCKHNMCFCVCEGFKLECIARFGRRWTLMKMFLPRRGLNYFVYSSMMICFELFCAVGTVRIWSSGGENWRPSLLTVPGRLFSKRIACMCRTDDVSTWPKMHPKKCAKHVKPTAPLELLHHAIFSQLMQKCIEQFAQKMSNLQFFIDWWYWWFLGLAGIVFPIGALLCLNRASAKVFVCCSWAMLLLRVLNYSFCYGRVWLRFAVYFFWAQTT